MFPVFPVMLPSNLDKPSFNLRSTESAVTMVSDTFKKLPANVEKAN